ncbi:retrovirus-related pol polyprotein from transposon TNT 1-94, partial [Tanacetum coccineum]
MNRCLPLPKLEEDRGSECSRTTELDSEKFARGAGAARNGGAHNKAGNANAGQGKLIKCYNCNEIGNIARNCTQPKRPQNSNLFKDKMLLMQAQENGAVLDEEELLFLAGEQTKTFDADVDDQPVRDLAQNDDNIFQADECDAFDSDFDDEPTAQSIFMANLSSIRPANLQVGPSNASILSEIHDLENTIDQCDDNQDEHETHNEKMDDQMSILIQDRNKKEENLKKKLHSVKLQLNSTIKSNKIIEETVTALKPLYDGDEILKTHRVPVSVTSSKEDLEIAEITRQKMNEKMNDHVVAMTHADELEAKNPKLLEKIPNDNHDTMIKDFSKLEITHLNLQLKHQHLKENIENFKSKSSKDVPEFDAFLNSVNGMIRFKSLDSQNLQLTKTVTALQEQVEYFKAENEKVKQHYQELFNSIKITRVETIERRTSLQTKIENLKTQLKGRCHASLAMLNHQRDVHHHYLNRLRDTLDTLYEIVEEAKSKRPSDHYACVYTKQSQELLENVSASCLKAPNNATNHVKHPTVQKTNVPIIHSTGVSNATKARRSQSKSNKMNDKTLPANSVPEKKVEDQHRKNKSKLSKKNRVDSSTSVKQTWKPTGKVFTTMGYHWKPIGRIFPLGAQFPLTRNTKPKVVHVKQWKPIGRLIPLGGQIPLVRPTALNHGCSKHMTGDRSLLRNFVKKFIGTVRFGNDHFGAIMGYGDYVIGDSVISRVYYVKGLGHNLFSVGSRGTNLYTISVEDMMRSSPICLLSKASKKKSWLWHRRLNHLNFGTLNDLARKDLARGLPRLKFEKDHLCSACQLGKSRKATHKPEMVNIIMEVLHTLHMDLCGPMRVQSINVKKYILVIVDDYSRHVRTDNGTEFVNKDLTAYYESVNITHEKTVPRTPQQNGIVEQRNHTLVEATQTMLIFSKAPMFLWAEAIATACYTQNRSLIHTLHNKTPYELMHDKKPDLSFLRVFGALCYPTNDSEDLGKLKAKADIGQTALVHSSLRPTPNLLTPGPISSGLVPNPTLAAPYVPPTYKELEILFQLMFDEYFEPPIFDHLVTPVPAAQVPV